jgi:hypothetical protein
MGGMEAMDEETELLAQGTTMDNFFLQTHNDMSLRLTGENTHSLTEVDESIERDIQVTLLEVVE